MVQADPQLQQLLDEHKFYFELTPDGKVHCLINKRDFPARYDVVAAFVKGSKFATLKKRYDADNSLTKYEPFIVPSMNFPNMLYCSLTGQLMEKSVQAIKTHMRGRKFHHNKELFAADKRELKPEPEIGAVLAEIMGRKLAMPKAKRDENGDVIPGEFEEDDRAGEEDGEAEEADEETGEEDKDAEDMEADDMEAEDEQAPSNGHAAKPATVAAPKPQPGKPVKAEKAVKAGEPAAPSAPDQQQRQTGSKRARNGAKVLPQSASAANKSGGKQQQAARGKSAQGAVAGDQSDEAELWVPDEFMEMEGALGEEDASAGEIRLHSKSAKPAKKSRKGKAAETGKHPSKAAEAGADIHANGSAPTVAEHKAPKQKKNKKASKAKQHEPDDFVFSEGEVLEQPPEVSTVVDVQSSQPGKASKKNVSKASKSKKARPQ